MVKYFGPPDAATWHFVTPEDIRWLLKLTAPRVEAFNALPTGSRNLTIRFKRSNDIIIKALKEVSILRTELQTALKHKKIIASSVQLSALMMKAN